MKNHTNITRMLKTQLFGFSAMMLLCLSVFMLYANPMFAFASDEEATGIAVILPNMTEFVPMLVAFIVLCLILGKFGWPMFSGMLDKRENSIREALEQSENAKIESEKLLEEYKQQLENAKTEASEIVNNARKNAEVLEKQLKVEAEKSAEEIIEKAKGTIEAEKKAAVAELQASVADMTIDVASKLIANDLSDDEHRAIIEKYVSEAGSFNG